ncbi:FAD-dependent oxidoreductase [Hydrogenophaga sp.]|uniref:FAD-dependent oxidoreductase n=1 Tax=Hydrogenophaga sp. TaxID=1904254 RepID=UPI0025BD0D2C|nr:FAD-dependent oxidoreductase [Hydrogenophaga sp.]
MRRLLLIGAGHAHAQVLLDWAHRPVPGAELCVVSPHALAPYSGMVPGWLGGSYGFEEICIDFDQLARRAGATFLTDELHALDPGSNSARLASGVVVDFDVASLNVGSTLRPPSVDGPQVLALRPLGELKTRWDRVLQDVCSGEMAAGNAIRVTAVGGGAAGFESLLAVLARLRALQPQRPVQAELVTRGGQLLPGLARGAVRSAEQALTKAGVRLRVATPWTPAMAEHTDLLLWGTGAQAHAWQTDAARRGGLAVSEQGFVRVNPELRSVSHPNVYAAGDCAHWTFPLPKAGVYAVRMGPVLSRNLRAALGDAAPASFKPQHNFLALLATADGRAIGSRGRLHAEGRWLWRLKDRIDRGFLARFQSPAAHCGLVQPVSSGNTP